MGTRIEYQQQAAEQDPYNPIYTRKHSRHQYYSYPVHPGPDSGPPTRNRGELNPRQLDRVSPSNAQPSQIPYRAQDRHLAQGRGYENSTQTGCLCFPYAYDSLVGVGQPTDVDGYPSQPGHRMHNALKPQSGQRYNYEEMPRRAVEAYGAINGVGVSGYPNPPIYTMPLPLPPPLPHMTQETRITNYDTGSCRNTQTDDEWQHHNADQRRREGGLQDRFGSESYTGLPPNQQFQGT